MPKNFSKSQKLAMWFWSEILQKEINWVDKDFRRLLFQCSYMLGKMNLDDELIKRAINLMIENAEMPASPNEVYLKAEFSTGKTWYELGKNPIALAPPVYETRKCLNYLKKFIPNSSVIPFLQQELSKP